MKTLPKEGFRQKLRIKSPEDGVDAEPDRVRSRGRRRDAVPRDPAGDPPGGPPGGARGPRARQPRDLKIAPFHLMATEGAVHVDKSHHWHMATIDALCRQDPILCTTEHLTVDVTDDEQVASATDWWTCQTSAGHEGMVMKPLDFVTRTERGLVAPAVKCRGREYLRIIYGPEYTREEQMARLRKRTVGRYVTRKGAIRARRDDRGIVPGSMGTRSYIVRGKGCSEALDSCPHGAGRRMSRTQAKALYNADDMTAQTRGVECRKDEGVVDEIPGAYKNIDEVVRHAGQLVEIEHTLKQVICVKG